jgi:hypothetical protein
MPVLHVGSFRREPPRSLRLSLILFFLPRHRSERSLHLALTDEHLFLASH